MLFSAHGYYKKCMNTYKYNCMHLVLHTALINKKMLVYSHVPILLEGRQSHIFLSKGFRIP